VASNQALTASTTNIALSTTLDSHGAWNGSQFTVPVPGDYMVYGIINFTTSTNHTQFVYVNGTLRQQFSVCNSVANATGSTLVTNLKYGDIISLRDNGSLTTSANTDSKICITRVSGANINSSDGRVVDLIVEKTSTQSSITANTTKITYDTVIKDTHGMWSSDTATIRVAGDYIMTVGYKTATSSTTCLLYKNGSNFKTLGSPNSTYHLIFTRLLTDLKVGDTLDLRQGSTENSVGDSSGAYFISLSRVAGPNQIAASETISASYYMSASGTYSTTAPINMDTKEYDTHNAVTTGVNWKFTAPAAGLYSVGGSIDIATGASVTIYKNGTSYKRVGYDIGSTDSTYYGTLRLVAGDYIDIRPNGSVTVAGSATLAASPTNINIIRVGL